MTQQARIDKGLYWLGVWISVFCTSVLRRHEYLGGRISIGYAALIARVVADSCARIRVWREGA